MVNRGEPWGRWGVHARRWLCLALCQVMLAASPAGAADTQLITYPDRADYALDRDQLRALFTMRVRQWPDGKPVQIFVVAEDDPLHERFCREQLGMYPYVLHQIWDRLVFTGTGLAPTVVHGEAQMRSLVASTPGAIGYVAAERGEAGRAAPGARSPTGGGKQP